MNSEKRKTGFIIAAAVVLLTVLKYGLMFVSDSLPDISDQITYGKGIRLINSGDYESAERFFDDLFYKDWDKYGDACNLSYYAKYLQYKGKDIAKESYYINKAATIISEYQKEGNKYYFIKSEIIYIDFSII